MVFHLIAKRVSTSKTKACVSTPYLMRVYRGKIATYILILSFAFPLFELKCMLPCQEIIVPRYTIWGSKNIKIQACPTMSIANLDKHTDTLISQLPLNPKSIRTRVSTHTKQEKYKHRTAYTNNDLSKQQFALNPETLIYSNII